MRRPTTLFVVLLAFGLGPRAEAQSVRPPAPSPQATPTTMIARLMSFDNNQDGRVQREELPERMQPLLLRRGVDRDAALVPEEAAKLVDRALRQQLEFPRGLEPGVYGLGTGGEPGFLLESHLNGAIEDLRLASGARTAALAIARAFVERLDARASTRLAASLNGILSSRQMQKLAKVVDASPRITTRVIAQPREVGNLAGPPIEVPQNLGAAIVVNSVDLNPAKREQALGAFERFRIDSRPTAEDREELTRQFASVLTAEQHDDLRAALERRPVVNLASVKVTPELKAARPPTIVLLR